MNVSIVIPTATNSVGLKKCLKSIEQYTDMNRVQLVIIANGHPEETKKLVGSYQQKYNRNQITLQEHPTPIGFSKAINNGIECSYNEYIVFLNDDIELIPQSKNKWLDILLYPFFVDIQCGATGPLLQKTYAHDLYRTIIGFCMCTTKTILSHVGNFDTGFVTGAGEDTDWCIRLQSLGYTIHQVPDEFELQSQNNMKIGGFPIVHYAEKTVKEVSENWNMQFYQNDTILLLRYNPSKLIQKLNNGGERPVVLPGEPVPPREDVRYQTFANFARDFQCKTIVDVGCGTGYGSRYFKDLATSYSGFDNDLPAIAYCKQTIYSTKSCKITFHHDSIEIIPELLKYKTITPDMIICSEILEHLSNGMDVFVDLINAFQGKLLLFTVPYNENPGYWGKHHKLHNLTPQSFFKKVQEKYGDSHPHLQFSLFLESGKLVNFDEKNSVPDNISDRDLERALIIIIYSPKINNKNG